MDEAASPESPRPGIGRVVFTAALTIWFIVRSFRWWLAVGDGTVVIGDMTTWEWAKVGFYHLAVVAGVAAIIEMFQARAIT